MRLALVSDIHGNSIALDALLADIAAAGGVDTFVVLGDMVAIGPDPVGVLERLRTLPAAAIVRGNTDRYLITGDRPTHLFGAETDEQKAALRIALADSFSWTQGVVTAAGWYDWIAALPFDTRIDLPDGTRLRGLHGTHRADDENSLRPSATDDELRALLVDCDAELLCAGHTHLALDRRLGPTLRLVNPGCVSNPIRPDGGLARYAIVDATGAGYTVEPRRVDYDHEAFAAQLRAVHHPAAEYIVELHRRARTGLS
jgi:predicted phosphodiesterase